METPITGAIWAITAGIALLVIGTDLAWAFARRNRVTTVKESVGWTLFYIASAISFGFFLMAWQNPIVGEEYFATWVTQYPLSIDNLFVFIIILAKLNIPREISLPVIWLTQEQVNYYQSMPIIPNKTLAYYQNSSVFVLSTIALNQYTATATILS